MHCFYNGILFSANTARNADLCNDIMDLKHFTLRSQTKNISLYNSIYMKCPEKKHLWKQKVAIGCQELGRSPGGVGTRINCNHAGWILLNDGNILKLDCDQDVQLKIGECCGTELYLNKVYFLKDLYVTFIVCKLCINSFFS